MNPNHPTIIRLLDAIHAGGAEAEQAAIDLLELLEPPTLDVALRHPCVTRHVDAEGTTAAAVRAAWATYNDRRDASWN